MKIWIMTMREIAKPSDETVMGASTVSLDHAIELVKKEATSHPGHYDGFFFVIHEQTANTIELEDDFKMTFLSQYGLILQDQPTIDKSGTIHYNYA